MNEFLFIHSSASDPSSMLYVKSALLPILLLPSSLIIKCFLLAVRGKEKKKLRKIKIAERLKKVKSSGTSLVSAADQVQACFNSHFSVSKQQAAIHLKSGDYCSFLICLVDYRDLKVSWAIQQLCMFIIHAPISFSLESRENDDVILSSLWRTSIQMVHFCICFFSLNVWAEITSQTENKCNKYIYICEVSKTIIIN